MEAREDEAGGRRAVTGWRPGERPGDLLRVVAALAPDHDESASVDQLARALGINGPEQEVAGQPAAPEGVAGSVSVAVAWVRDRAAVTTNVRRDYLAAVATLAAFVGTIGFALAGWIGLAVAELALVLTGGLLLLWLSGSWRPRSEPSGPSPPRISEEPLRIDAPPPTRQPPTSTLIEPGEMHSVAHELVRARLPGHRPDLDRARHRIEVGRSPLPLAWLRRRHVAPHTQVLVDIGPSMGPLRDDVHQLVDALSAVAGQGRIERLSFKGSPDLRAGSGRLADWSPYDAGAVGIGTRVIALTDAGLAGGVVPPGWGVLADAWSEGGASAVLLTPYPVDSYAEWLRDKVALVHWNDRLTADQVARRLSEKT